MTTTKQILQAYGPIGEQAIKNDLRTVNATGKTVDSVRFEVKSEGTVDRITYYAREYIKALETGISPTTKGPSREMIENLTEYARARGFSDPKNAAWGLAKKIQREGDKTKRQGGRIVYSDTLIKISNELEKMCKENFRIKFMQTIKGAAVILLFMLSSCGTVQTVNGINLKHPVGTVKKEVTAGVMLFVAGYYVQKEYNVIKKWLLP